MNTRKLWLALGCLPLLLLISIRTYAGGPLLVRAPGVPFLWPNGGLNIPFNPDQGGLGPMPNAVAVAQTTAAFGAWAAIPSASATHLNGGSLPVDVDETNFEPYLNPTAPDGLSAIVYDEDGAIFNLLFGPNSGILGFATPEWIDETTGRIIEGVSFLNGGALVGPNAFPIAEFLSVQVHEYGHYQNLAHTVVNGQIIAGPDSRGPSPNNTFPPPPGGFVNRIETMYPFLFINGGMATPHADDIAIFSRLYPEPTFGPSTGTITGRIIAPNATSPVTGVNVIARNIVNPYDDAVSGISSDFTRNYSPSNPFTGRYTLRGLTPGASYAVYVDEILVGGFSTPPRNPLPGPEEFYNGSLESNHSATDAPNEFTPVVALAGVTISGINIIFNRIEPGPIPVGDDSSVELFPKFPFKFCGQSFDSVWVNGNGNLTFGSFDDDFSESIAEHLMGLPRIAGLWDDLNPEGGGSVSYTETSRSITIRFTNVPEFENTGANTFSFTLRADPDFGRRDDEDSSRFTIAYGGITAQDGLAGYSCGARIASGFERETDLSRRAWWTIDGEHETAIFEVFTALDNDLDNRTLRFIGPEQFRDEFEPNNSLSSSGGNGGRGDCDCDRRGHDRDRDCDDRGHDGHSHSRLVRLPFSTVDRFSDISPLGDDVDFYRFRAKAGEILAIETVPGNASMDTYIGLFDAGGNMLIANDDSGVGLLSRLLVVVPADGTYAVGVTTFPDAAFTGEGEDFGRYVLTINTYTGTVIQPGDDGAAVVPLGFTFPFQGANWTSVFVNGNGNLTFGAADPDFTETVPELLAGAPRIAPLWDDLFAPAGLVIAEPGHDSMTIHFVSVPEFSATGTNYFSVEMKKSGDVSINYGATNRSDALVGLSQGGGAADPGPTDLSEDRSQSAVGTTYETFIGSFGNWNGVDLSFSSVEFKKRRFGHNHD